MTQSPAGPVSKQIRIAYLGIRHESNTFAPEPTTHAHFQIIRDMDALTQRLGGGQHLAGADVSAVYLANATPGGVVTHDAYARLKAECLDVLRAALPVDSLPPLRCQSVSFIIGSGSQARETPAGFWTWTRVVISKVRQGMSAAAIASAQGSAAATGMAMPDLTSICRAWKRAWVRASRTNWLRVPAGSGPVASTSS